MFNVGGGELLVIMLLALIILGPQRLPTAARTVGRVMGDLRRISSGFQQELKDAFDDGESPTPLRRKESVPLDSTVAEADKAGAKELNAARADDDGSTSDSAAVPPGADRGPAPVTARAAADDVGSGPDPARDDDEAADTTVAPAVAAALDEIVTPIEPSAGPPPAAPADAPEGRGDDAVGDQRAAS
jgi:sec-independent protein translocase protein TatB